jgi:two-component system, NtrC family, sensor kinase
MNKRPDRNRFSGLPLISSRSIGVKLFGLLAVGLVVVLGVVGVANVRLHRDHLEDATLLAAERTSDIIKRSTEHYMMLNDREAIYYTIQTIADEPGIRRIRIFNQEGQISFSTDEHETGSFVDTDAEACYACHAQSEPLTHLDRPDRFRIFKSGGERLIGVITPIPNSPECSNAACHAHPAEQQVLGVLDTTLSLARTDADIEASSWTMFTYMAIAILTISIIIAVFVWRLVHRPVRRLRQATERLREGQLGYELEVRSSDELGELATSFNQMSRRLAEADDELRTWNKTLEHRVDMKSEELSRAHEHMLQAEKLTSLGKMAAVVAHEINNPLSGILTYARLMRKWIERGDDLQSRAPDMRESLELIESESRRCGAIVKDLLTFARPTPMNVQPVDLNAALRQCVRLVDHKLELSAIALREELSDEVPRIEGDPGQLEQLFLALIMNAIEAMGRDGVLRLATSRDGDDHVTVVIEDNGVGMPESLIPNMFEPFVTTKQDKSGTGLGLAISKRIVDNHGGEISVASTPGRGTAFTIKLPLSARGYPGARRPGEEEAHHEHQAANSHR